MSPVTIVFLSPVADKKGSMSPVTNHEIPLGGPTNKTHTLTLYSEAVFVFKKHTIKSSINEKYLD
jgi:hypothetical protein